jgi:hypothetical protein
MESVVSIAIGNRLQIAGSFEMCETCSIAGGGKINLNGVSSISSTQFEYVYCTDYILT